MPGWTRFYTDEKRWKQNLQVDLHIDNVMIESENISQFKPYQKRPMTQDKVRGIA